MAKKKKSKVGRPAIKKPRAQLSVKIQASILRAFDKECQVRGQSKVKCVEIALVEFALKSQQLREGA